MSKAARLRRLISSPQLEFLLGAHDAASAKIAEQAGFAGIWASGLCISAALGVRDNNEASWTEMLHVVEFMSDATAVPILMDGDTGYGNFNNMRRLVRKLEQRQVAGVCIEDKLFPKANSFSERAPQPLADIDEFAGKIKAGKDAQLSADFVIVARLEAFIASRGLAEALRRAHAYADAGADAILVHSARRDAREVLSFQKEWGGRLPVIVIPTKYYTTPTDVLRDAGFSVCIWANQLLRAALPAMRHAAAAIRAEQTVAGIEDRLAPLAEVFELQGEEELAAAEKRYLPTPARAIVLAVSRGEEMAELTTDRPKAMIDIGGGPLLGHIVDAYRSVGVSEIAVVRGYKKEAVNLPGVTYFDNDRFAASGEARSLLEALPALEGRCIVSYGDVLFRKHVPQILLDCDDDFVVPVDTNWEESRNRNRVADYAICSLPSSKRSYYQTVTLKDIVLDRTREGIHGEWMGFIAVSARGAEILKQQLLELSRDAASFDRMSLADLMRQLIAGGQQIRVLYSTGHWLDVDSLDDLILGTTF